MNNPDNAQRFNLQTILSLRGSKRPDSAGAGDEKVFQAVKAEFHVGDTAVHEEDRYGGVKGGGYHDRYLPTDDPLIFVKETFNSSKGILAGQPSAREVTRVTPEEAKRLRGE